MISTERLARKIVDGLLNELVKELRTAQRLSAYDFVSHHLRPSRDTERLTWLLSHGVTFSRSGKTCAVWTRKMTDTAMAKAKKGKA